MLADFQVGISVPLRLIIVTLIALVDFFLAVFLVTLRSYKLRKVLLKA